MSEESKTGSVQPIDDATLAQLAEKSGDTVEHMKEMLNVTDPQPEGEETPQSLLAGKYKTEADLEKGIDSLIDKYGKENAYKILESALGKDQTANHPVDDKTDANPQISESAEKDALLETPKKIETDESGRSSGNDSLNLDKYSQEFMDNGQLSEDSYQELQEKGIPKTFVDQYITGLKASAEKWTNSVYQMAGGEAEYDALISWAADNLSDNEKEVYNQTLQSMDSSRMGMVLDALKARYEKTNGPIKRNALEPQTSHDNAYGTQGYRSIAEYQQDLSDPRYTSGDDAFIQHVMNKVKKTTIF